MADVTEILNAIEAGDEQAASQLLPLVYDELRKLAAAKLAREQPGQTLNATALVHEAYMRLANPCTSAPTGFANRHHFLGAAAVAMRRILVEAARRKGRVKHGGLASRLNVDLDKLAAPTLDGDVVALHEALEQFALHDSKKAKLVELRFFGGLTLSEAAEYLGISLSTADRAWRYARAWLYAEMARAK